MTEKNQPLTWKEVFLANKGPKTLREVVILFIKGVFMGIANIIPGVSGGTMALITGIYQDVMQAIRSADLNTLRFLVRLEIKQAMATIHLRFLIILFSGAVVAIFALAHFVNFILNNYPTYTYSLFFGLILASILVMALKTSKWLGPGGISFLLGTAGSYLFVGLIPVSTPETWWFILLTGAVIICTMILPGLSGAFLLLIIGKYEFITAALKNPFDLQNFIVLSLFLLGCIVGIISFSRVLTVLFSKYENTTMAALTGIMCGSLRKIWPWKEVLETKIIGSKVLTLAERNILPSKFDAGLILAFGLIVVGFVVVIVLEKSASQQ